MLKFFLLGFAALAEIVAADFPDGVNGPVSQTLSPLGELNANSADQLKSNTICDVTADLYATVIAVSGSPRAKVIRGS